MENAVLLAFNGTVPEGLVLKTDNGPQYISKELRSALKFLGINLEYIRKHTPEDNGDIESFHNSIKTDYIGPNEFRNFNDASIEVEKAFYDYNECGPLKHSIALDDKDIVNYRLIDSDGTRRMSSIILPWS